MRKTIRAIICTLLLIITSNVLPDERQQQVKNVQTKSELKDIAQYQKIIDEYKTHLANVDQKTKNEIIEFRKIIAKLNKSQRKMKDALPASVRDYLNKESEYKKKLPLNYKHNHLKDPTNNDDQMLQKTARSKEEEEFKKIINNYRIYVSQILPKTHEEARAYKKKVLNLYKKKKKLYKKLSNAAQNFLKTEQKYRKKLPANRRFLMKITLPKTNPSS